MPSITVKYNDMCGLLGKEISAEKLCDHLNMLGVETEIAGDELKIEIAHNRPDLLSPEGVARALKGFLGIKTGAPQYKISGSNVAVDVDKSTDTIRPFIAAAVVKEVDLTDDIVASLMQVQEKLHTSLCRNRKIGSIGVYDFNRVAPPLKYTTVLPEEVKFVPLDSDFELTPQQILQEHPKGIEYDHLLRGLPRYPLLLDSNGTVLSMPPVINSEATRVTESTKNLFIDVTGTEERVTARALNVLVTSLAERGFKIFSVTVKYPNKKIVTPNLKPLKNKLSVKSVNDYIGLKLEPAAIAKIAKRMRYGVEGVNEKAGTLTLLTPAYRTDIMHEVDLIEDIAIGYGYERLEPELPPVMTTGEPLEIERICRRARLVMMGLGFMEAIGYTLTNPHKEFELMRMDGNAVELSNPASEEFTIVRGSLLPSLLSALYENRRHPTPQKLFEIGDVSVLDAEAETGAKNVRKVAAVLIGRGANFTQIKAVTEAVLRELNLNFELKSAENPSFLDGRAVALVSGDKKIGVAGEINPEVLLGFGLENPVAAFEIDLS